MYGTLDTATDGRRIVRVRFTRESPRADEPSVVAIYHVQRPDSPALAGDPYFMSLLSVTRVDTREPVILTQGERAAVEEVVMLKAVEDSWT